METDVSSGHTFCPISRAFGPGPKLGLFVSRREDPRRQHDLIGTCLQTSTAGSWQRGICGRAMSLPASLHFDSPFGAIVRIQSCLGCGLGAALLIAMNFGRRWVETRALPGGAGCCS